MKHKSILLASEKVIFPYSPKREKRASFALFDFFLMSFHSDVFTTLFKIPFYQLMIKYLVRNKIKKIYLNPRYVISLLSHNLPNSFLCYRNIFYFNLVRFLP